MTRENAVVVQHPTNAVAIVKAELDSRETQLMALLGIAGQGGGYGYAG